MNDIKDQLTTLDASYVECLVPDLGGAAKGKIVSSNAFQDGTLRLPEALFGQDVTGEWCEDHDLLDIADVDMQLAPDVATLLPQPWSPGTAQCLCDCETLSGAALDIAPRGLLKRILSEYQAMGLVPMIAQEAEFYLVAANPDPTQPVTAASGRSGRTPGTPRSYQVEALGEYSAFTERLRNWANLQGIEINGLVQEMGQGQLEANFPHDNALKKADEMFLFKRLARQAAEVDGNLATFIAKPMSHLPGSAMHLHQSLVDADTGNNVFAGDNGGYSDTFLAYLGGLQHYALPLMAFLAPNVNSYRRFEGAESCPTNLAWGVDNRTTGFRIPRGPPAATRIENRLPGSDTNPYLAIAASLACGLLGIRENRKPGEATDGNAWDLPYGIPRTLRESLEHLRSSDALAELMGERLLALFVDIKMRELRAFSAEVTTWEREFLLLTS